MWQNLSKQQKFLAVSVVSFLLIIAVIVWVLIRQKYEPKDERISEPTLEERIIQEQIKELDRLREEAGDEPLTNKEIEQQTNELDALREQAMSEEGSSGNVEFVPFTQEEIEQQISELDMLREQANQ